MKWLKELWVELKQTRIDSPKGMLRKWRYLLPLPPTAFCCFMIYPMGMQEPEGSIIRSIATIVPTLGIAVGVATLFIIVIKPDKDDTDETNHH